MMPAAAVMLVVEVMMMGRGFQVLLDGAGQRYYG
jgi:hypothetical protein